MATRATTHFIACMLALVALLVTSRARAGDPITLQLKWQHQFQFAGYYAAIEQGYYRDAGLDVTLVEAKAEDDPIRRVLDGHAQYGVGNAELVLEAARGKPVVLLAAIFQHSPLVVLASKESGITSVQQLAGKRVSLEAQSAELVAYFEREGVPLAHVLRVQQEFVVDPLVDKRIDAMSAYVTDEPFALEERHHPYVVLDPRTAGIDFYGDTLFTTERELGARPGRVRALREATLRGWRWAMAHEDETIELILAKYSQRHSRAHLKFEAEQTRKLVLPDVVELGYINPGRIEHIANVYAETGMLPSVPDSLALHIYTPNHTPADRRPLLALAGVSALLILALAAIARFRKLVARLEDAERKQAELVRELRTLALSDSLTRLANRRAGEDLAHTEIARSKRHGRPLALLLVDVDHFKRVNDVDGHLVGDQVLKEVARTMQATARTSDTVARMGGEEFMVLAPETTESGARILSERLRAAIEEQTIATDRGPRSVTVSVGVALLNDGADAFHELWRRADVAMYESKARGRNSVTIWSPEIDPPNRGSVRRMPVALPSSDTESA